MLWGGLSLGKLISCSSRAGDQSAFDLLCFCSCDQPTSTRGLDRLANQSVPEMSLDPVRDRAARSDHGDTFVQAARREALDSVGRPPRPRRGGAPRNSAR